MSKLDDILDNQDWGYLYQMSDYAGSRDAEKKYERAGKRQVKKAKQQIKDLMLELIGENSPLIQEDIMTLLERRTEGLHPYSADYQSVMRETCLDTGTKLGKYSLREELCRKVEDL